MAILRNLPPAGPGPRRFSRGPSDVPARADEQTPAHGAPERNDNDGQSHAPMEGSFRPGSASCRRPGTTHMPEPERKEHTMTDERRRKHTEHDDEPDVEAHIVNGGDLGEPDPEMKRDSSDVEDSEDGGLDRKRK